MGNAAELDGTWRRRVTQQRQQPSSQGEMAKIVDAELHLEPVLRCFTCGQRHHSGVIDQDVETGMGNSDPRGKVGNGGEARKIESFKGNPGARYLVCDAINCAKTLSLAAGSDDNFMTVFGSVAQPSTTAYYSRMPWNGLPRWSMITVVLENSRISASKPGA